LLGFCGAPWTVASYMIAGRGTPDLAPSNIESGVPKMNPDIYGRKIDQIQASENDAGLHTVAEEGLLVRYHCDQGRNLTH
jgi:hypothetical protein